MDKIFQWRCYTDVNTICPVGIASRWQIVIVISSPLRELDFDMMLSLSKYVGHNFRQTWFARQFKMCEEFLIGIIVSMTDFEENYSFQIEYEIQSMRWFKVQVTLLVHITYQHAQLLVDGI